MLFQGIRLRLLNFKEYTTVHVCGGKNILSNTCHNDVTTFQGGDLKVYSPKKPGPLDRCPYRRTPMDHVDLREGEIMLIIIIIKCSDCVRIYDCMLS